MFIELHAIQNFAPSNLNRDDTNNPKDCLFGGVRRARISSQCIKRAIRHAPVFSHTTQVDNGVRTKWLIQRLRKPLLAAGKSEEEVMVVLSAFVPAFASKLDGNDQKTAVLLYFSQAEIDDLAGTIAENWAELADETTREKTVKGLSKAKVKEFKNRTSAPDIALFGRMLAEKPELNLDAACQVAHAISTHRITMEMDFYTAVDDLNAGAAMMGVIPFDSACFYRYARLDWQQLVTNLDKDMPLARRTVEGFLRATIEAVPTGKQNSFAAHNPPSFLLAVVRNGGMAWSLANAFERAVRPAANAGYVAPSVAALDQYWGRLCQIYGTDMLIRTATLSLEPDITLENLSEAKQENLKQWVDAVLSPLPQGEEARA